jgi:hypothetical protein
MPVAIHATAAAGGVLHGLASAAGYPVLGRLVEHAGGQAAVEPFQFMRNLRD